MEKSGFTQNTKLRNFVSANIVAVILGVFWHFSLMQLSAQAYNATGYANGVVGAVYSMPGKPITSASELEVNQPDVVTCYYFDSADPSGPSFAKDSGVVFGIYNQNTANDTGGQDKRGYDTKSNAATTARYAPIRWNGGSNLWRQGGQWARYSIDFAGGTYNFLYRGNINSFAVASHKFLLKIFSPSDISLPLFEHNIDLSGGLPDEGKIKEGILRIGGGNTETDWFKLMDDIELPLGRYIVELSSPEISYNFSSWGVFTFNKSANYAGKPYYGNPFNADSDTVKWYEFDKISAETFFAKGDSGITAGVYNVTISQKGENFRGYADTNVYDVLKLDNARGTMVSTGAWYKYSVEFGSTKPHYLCFRGSSDLSAESGKNVIRVINIFSDKVVGEYDLSSESSFMSGSDKGAILRWKYLHLPAAFDPGKYIIEVNLKQEADHGLFESFSFTSENPANKIPMVKMFPWPENLRNDKDLYSDLYTVKIHQDGEVYDMFMHQSIPDTRPSKYPPDNGGNGVMKELYDRTFNFCLFEYTGEIEVEATKLYGSAATRVEIQPKAYGINPYYFDGRTVKFRIKHTAGQPSYISINFVSDDNLDDQPLGGQKAVKHGLMIFGDKPEVYKPDTLAAGTVFYSDNADSATVVNANLIYFRAGDWNLKKVFKRGVIDLTKNGQKVYLEGGAYVRGSVWSRGKNNVWLYGRGIISGWDMLFHELVDSKGVKDAFLAFYQSESTHIEGITIIDPTHHAIPTNKNSYFKNVKIIGWSYNQDGTRVGSGSFIEEMFTKTQDDRSYADRNHIYKNSIEWPMRNGAFAILGWGSYDGGKATYDNIYFINSEWERPEANVGNQAVLGSNIKQGSNQANDTLRNLYLEDYTTLLCILRINYDATEGDAWNPNDPGEIKNFLFENIKVEQPFITTNGTRKFNRIEGFIKDGVTASVHDITFRNLVVAGQLILNHNKGKYFYIDPKTTYNINFEVKGDVHTLRTANNAGGKVFPSGDLAVPDGTNQYVSVEPNPGYRIKDVKVDYQSVGPLSVINLTNVTSDHHIEVEFEAGENVFDFVEVKDPNTVLTDTIHFGVDHVKTAVNFNYADGLELLIYPNPASDRIMIRKAIEDSEVRIYNQLGIMALKSNSEDINVEELQPGIYFVRCENKISRLIISK